MDAVILAGGKGSRLGGVLPPYMKPFMPVRGVPLVARLVNQVEPYVHNTFVVVAPENALQMAHVLKGHRVYMVVQPTAKGPGDALAIALTLTKQQKVLVLMGDNLMPDADIDATCQVAQESDYVIGVGYVRTAEEAARFTRIYADGGRIEEGPDVTPTDLLDPVQYRVWCGPLVLPVVAALWALRLSDEDILLGEKKIGTHLGRITKAPRLVRCSALDIGTPEALMEVQE